MMTDLTTRCEQAEGPDRSLFEEAWNALFPKPDRADEPEWPGPGHLREPNYHYWYVRKKTFMAMLDAKAYLDAALTLVPEGWRLQLSDWDDETLRSLGKWQAILTPPGKRCSFDEWWPRCNHASTPALALCAASLRARAHAKDQADE